MSITEALSRESAVRAIRLSVSAGTAALSAGAGSCPPAAVLSATPVSAGIRAASTAASTASAYLCILRATMESTAAASTESSSMALRSLRDLDSRWILYEWSMKKVFLESLF